jgi:SAM-dependent methyltransferase
VREALPLPDSCVEIYQSEDVFEHVPYDSLPAVFDEIYRVLKPGGLFRLSMPDYRADVYQERTLRNTAGEMVFDPGGGGSYRDGKVIDGGHVWLPRFELVEALFGNSKFATYGTVDFLHYIARDGTFVIRDIDYSLGHVSRTPDHDDRVRSPRRPLSIVVDARRNV